MPPAQVRALIHFIHNQGLTPLPTIYHPHKCGFKCLAGEARGTFRCPLRGQFNQPERLISPCRLARFNPATARISLAPTRRNSSTNSHLYTSMITEASAYLSNVILGIRLGGHAPAGRAKHSKLSATIAKHPTYRSHTQHSSNIKHQTLNIKKSRPSACFSLGRARVAGLGYPTRTYWWALLTTCLGESARSPTAALVTPKSL